MSDVNTAQHVLGDALVFGYAMVYGDAEVYGDAMVSGDARVCGNARVFGYARVSGRAWVAGNGVVQSRSDIAWIDRVADFRSITLHRTVDGWQINIRKFDGADAYVATTIAEVCAAVAADHGGEVVAAALAYLAAAVDRS